VSLLLLMVQLKIEFAVEKREIPLSVGVVG